MCNSFQLGFDLTTAFHSGLSFLVAPSLPLITTILFVPASQLSSFTNYAHINLCGCVRIFNWSLFACCRQARFVGKFMFGARVNLTTNLLSLAKTKATIHISVPLLQPSHHSVQSPIQFSSLVLVAYDPFFFWILHTFKQMSCSEQDDHVLAFHSNSIAGVNASFCIHYQR